MKNTCQYCKHAKALGAMESGTVRPNGEQSYICRRYPPLAVPLMQNNPLTNQSVLGIQGVHPPVRAGDSCGEFSSAYIMSGADDTG